jgi:Type II CAAX prenyl endopeptidase Rce1-like
VINLILVNLWEETAWAGVMQTRLERRHNIFAAVLTALPFGFIHLPLTFLSEITGASVLISLPRAADDRGGVPALRRGSRGPLARRSLKVIAMRNLAKWSVQLPGLAELSPANETVSVISRWNGSHCVWWPFAVARGEKHGLGQIKPARLARSHYDD